MYGTATLSTGEAETTPILVGDLPGTGPVYLTRCLPAPMTWNIRASSTLLIDSGGENYTTAGAAGLCDPSLRGWYAAGHVTAVCGRTGRSRDPMRRWPA